MRNQTISDKDRIKLYNTSMSPKAYEYLHDLHPETEV